MDGGLKFDYYYGIEAEQFSFYRVPRLLIKDVRFKGLSSDAKLLYGLMLDRMALSMKNGWLDEENRAYIHYTMDSIMEDLGCAREKCAKVLAELDSKKGIGLIEKKRQGLGKPDIIYVKNFTTLEVESKPSDIERNTAANDNSPEVRKSNFKKYENQTSGDTETEFQEGRKPNFKKYENQTSGSSKIELAEVRKPNPNYNNINYTDNSYTNPIYPSSEKQEKEEKQKAGEMDGMDDTETYIQINNTGNELMREVIDNFLRTGETDIVEPYASLMKEAATEYADIVFQKLYDYEYNEQIMKLHFIGGGARIIEAYGSYNKDRVFFNHDIRAMPRAMSTTAI